jgi:protein-S-isoprenylcysteine O-methyltransferase Ste14
MVTETSESEVGLTSLAEGIRNLLGVGMHLLLMGLLLEGLAVVVSRWISFPISLTLETQIVATALCLAVCLLSALWFSRSLDLIEVHLLNGENEMITCGPFAYVRHPLYATLVMTIPPMVLVWFSDLLFLIPWILILVISHQIVRLEERELIEAFGRDYESYRSYVPALLPYKGAGGKRYRGDSS